MVRVAEKPSSRGGRLLQRRGGEGRGRGLRLVGLLVDRAVTLKRRAFDGMARDVVGHRPATDIVELVGGFLPSKQCRRASKLLPRRR